MTEHAQKPAIISTDIMVMDRVRDLVGYLPPDEQVLAAVNGRATTVNGHGDKSGLLAATTHRLLFYISKAAPTGPEYDQLDGVELHQEKRNGPLVLDMFGTSPWRPIITHSVKDAQRVVEAATQRIDYAHVAAGRLVRFAGILVENGTVTSPWGSGPLAGARGEVQTAGQISTRPSTVAVAAFGVAGLAFKKKTDERELFLTVEGRGFGFVLPLPPSRTQSARTFAVRLNGFAAGAAAQEPPGTSPGVEHPDGGGLDPFEQIRRLGELRDANLISAEEFETKKAQILARI